MTNGDGMSEEDSQVWYEYKVIGSWDAYVAELRQDVQYKAFPHQDLCEHLANKYGEEGWRMKTVGHDIWLERERWAGDGRDDYRFEHQKD